jgi:hypothetical protein
MPPSGSLGGLLEAEQDVHVYSTLCAPGLGKCQVKGRGLCEIVLFRFKMEWWCCFNGSTKRWHVLDALHGSL